MGQNGAWYAFRAGEERVKARPCRRGRSGRTQGLCPVLMRFKASLGRVRVRPNAGRQLASFRLGVHPGWVKDGAAADLALGVVVIELKAVDLGVKAAQEGIEGLQVQLLLPICAKEVYHETEVIDPAAADTHP